MADLNTAIASGLLGITGTLLGGSITAWFQYISVSRKEKIERQAARRAIAAEIYSIAASPQTEFELSVVETYFRFDVPPPPLPNTGYKSHPGLEKWQSHVRKKLAIFDDYMQTMLFLAPNPNQYFGIEIYGKLSAQVGAIGEESDDVHAFYSSVIAMRHFVGVIRNTGDRMVDIEYFDRMVLWHQLMIGECKTSIERGRELADRLRLPS